MDRARTVRSLAAILAVAAAVPMAGLRATEAPPACEPGGETVVLEGTVGRADARSYLLLPVQVAPGTTRVRAGVRELLPGFAAAAC